MKLNGSDIKGMRFNGSDVKALWLNGTKVWPLTTSMPSATRTLAFSVSVTLDGMTVDSAGNLWVAGFGSDGVTKYDGFSNTVLATADGNGDYRGIGFDGSHILASEFDDKITYKYTLAGGSAGSIAIHQNRDLEVVGGQLCYSSGSTIFVYNDAAGTTLLNSWDAVSDLGFSSGASVWAVTSVNNNLCLADEVTGDVRIFDGVSTTLLHSFSIGSAANVRGLVHDGTNLYSASNDGDVYVHTNV